MIPSLANRIDNLLSIMRRQRQAAQQQLAEVERGRRKIMEQVEAHEARLQQPSVVDHLPPDLILATRTAHYRSQRRLEVELAQLRELLVRFEREQIKPCVESLARAHQKTSALERLAERQAIVKRRSLQREEQDIMNEIALLRWKPRS